MSTSKIQIDRPLIERDPDELRRRNRRVGIIIATIVFVLTLLCALYIRFLGGVNKGPLQPFHSELMTSVNRATL